MDTKCNKCPLCPRTAQLYNNRIDGHLVKCCRWCGMMKGDDEPRDTTHIAPAAAEAFDTMMTGAALEGDELEIARRFFIIGYASGAASQIYRQAAAPGDEPDKRTDETLL